VAPSSLAERIKTVRNAWDWSQEEMAEILRVDQASISFWERGKIRPSGSALLALATLFRTTVDALENGDGFVAPSPPHRGGGLGKPRALPRTVCLPMTEPGRVTVVDLGSGDLSAQPLEEATILLDHFAKGDRKMWIVVE
jgi:transcriptional regulator with XRE-family HTH domain